MSVIHDFKLAQDEVFWQEKSIWEKSWFEQAIRCRGVKVRRAKLGKHQVRRSVDMFQCKSFDDLKS